MNNSSWDNKLCLVWFGKILIFQHLLQFLTSDGEANVFSQGCIAEAFKKVFVWCVYFRQVQTLPDAFNEFFLFWLQLSPPFTHVIKLTQYIIWLAWSQAATIYCGLFQHLKPGPLGQVRDIRLGHKQMAWNAGVMEYWNIGFRVSGSQRKANRSKKSEGFQPLTSVFWPLGFCGSDLWQSGLLSHYSITPILHRSLLTWLHPYGVKPVPGPLDPGIY